MNRLLIIPILIIGMFSSTFVPKAYSYVRQNVPIKVTSNNNTNKTQREPLILNIEIIYDGDYNAIEVISYDNIQAEVFLSKNDNIIDYSSDVNTVFYISNDRCQYVMQIKGDSWTAEGELTIP